MYSWKKRIAVCVFLMAAFAVFLPVSANAYQVYLSGFQSGYNSTGEIYGNDVSPVIPFYSFCLTESKNVYVPGYYEAQNVALTGNELKAAWLMKTYAPTADWAYGLYNSHNYNYEETGIAVQNAIWFVTNQTMNVTDTDVLALANYFVSTVGSNVSSDYVRMNLLDLDGNPVQDLMRPVPIPAAVWLLGTGLLGLFGIRRRFTS
jgi:hypothetical protein